MQSSLLNSKYEISRISISNKTEGRIELVKYGNFWGGTFSTESESVRFPADTKTVEEFISCAQRIITVQKVASSDSSKNKIEKNLKLFGVDSDSATELSFFYAEEQCVSKIFFGFLNQSLDRIFIRTEKTPAIYSVDSKPAEYLEINSRFWSDPNLIPSGVLNSFSFSEIQNFSYRLNPSSGGEFSQVAKSNYDQFLSLRYSEIISDFVPGEKSLELKLSDGNGTEYNMDFYPAQTKNGDCYIFKLRITPSELFDRRTREFLKNMNYSCAVSQWTYNSITELLTKK